MVDIHDEYRPTGYSRTYPNLMTQEGIGGDETSPENRQTLTILFTRMLAGAGDNTICYYDARVRRNSSHAYQLAKAVCLYSPWQFLYWYDRPAQSPHEAGGAGNSQRLIGDEPELEFFDAVPTVWDETRVLKGEIGQLAVIARRRGAEWYVGCMNAEQARTITLPLDFLEAGREYTATVYSDDPTVRTRTQVAVTRRTVDADTVLTISLSLQGGQAMRILPREPQP
jgi:alpha-glucosidase